MTAAAQGIWPPHLAHLSTQCSLPSSTVVALLHLDGTLEPAPSLRMLMATPQRALATPQRALATPQRALATPQRALATPQRALATPQRALATPLPARATPQARLSSTARPAFRTRPHRHPIHLRRPRTRPHLRRTLQHRPRTRPHRHPIHLHRRPTPQLHHPTLQIRLHISWHPLLTHRPLRRTRPPLLLIRPLHPRIRRRHLPTPPPRHPIPQRWLRTYRHLLRTRL